MEWQSAITRHRDALSGIVAALFSVAGLGEGRAVLQLPRTLHRAVLGVLLPAESAVRRLILVAAQALAVKPGAPRPAPKGLTKGLENCGKTRGSRAFQLFDPRQRFERGDVRRFGGPRLEPRIRVLDAGFDPRAPLFRPAPPAANQAAMPAGMVSAAALSRRLAAIRYALDDLPRQARRYARWRAKPFAARRPKRAAALRPGAPPGARRTPSHAVNAILDDCNRLALALPAPDTS